MADDLTGQNIQDTYQRVVQINEGQLQNGTGSNLPISIDGNDVTISGSLIATNYIVSSSVTNITIATKSGSTEFGDSSGDTHTFTGSIYTQELNGDVASFTTVLSNQLHVGGLSQPPGTLQVSGDSYFTGNITASNYRTKEAQGTITAGTASFSILHGNEANATGLVVNGYIDCIELSASTDVTVGETLSIGNGVVINESVTGKSQISSSGQLRLFSGNVHITNNAILGTNSNMLQVDGDIGVTQGNITTNRSIMAGMSITASGGISSSGTIHGTTYFSNGVNVLTYDGVNVKLGDDEPILLNNASTTATNITASGDISASGNIYGTIGTATQGTIDIHSLSGYVANEHLDWTADVGTIHAGNYTNTMGSGFTVSATTDSNATTITQGDDLMFTAGTGITCETTADGTVTITNTVSDTNTTPAGTYSSSLQTLTNITASGNISSSGDLTLSSSIYFGSSASIDFDSTLIIGRTAGSGNEKIRIGPDNIQFKTNDNDEAIGINDGNASVSIGYAGINNVYIGSGGVILYQADIASSLNMFKFKTKFGPNGTISGMPSNATVTISGSGTGIGSALEVLGNITASGDISSSGTITAPNYTGQIIVLDNVGCYISSADSGNWYAGKSTGKESGDWNGDPYTDIFTINDEKIWYGTVLPVSCSAVGFRGGFRVSGGGNAQVWIMTGSRSDWSGADTVPFGFGASSSCDPGNGQDFSPLDIPEFPIGSDCDFIQFFVATDDENKTIRGNGSLFART